MQVQTKSFLETTDDYIGIIISCLPKSIMDCEEILKEVVKKYPYVDIYSNIKYKRIIGNVIMLNDNKLPKKFILICSQLYAGSNDFPNDDKKKRLEYFNECLSKIDTNIVKNIAFPEYICRDNGGDWLDYYKAINDFNINTRLMEKNISINIYKNTLNLKSTIKQISLLNCINSLNMIDITKLKMVKDTIISIEFEKPKYEDILNKNIYIKNNKYNKKEETTKEIIELMELKELKEPNKLKELKETKELNDTNELKELKEPNELKDTNELKETTKEIIESIEPKEPIELKEPRELKEPMELKEPTKSDDQKTTVLKKQKKKKKPTPIKYYEPTEINPDWYEPLSHSIFNNIDDSWDNFFREKELHDILVKVDQEMKELYENINKELILPKYNDIFNAFKYTKLNELKVVIIGQDPYHNIGEAMGLSFSVNDGVQIPPSLLNIFKEIKAEYNNYIIPKTGNLIRWAEQGILLLNASLTVSHNKPGGEHIKIWEEFTNMIIKKISIVVDKPLVFMLWGEKKKSLINLDKHKHYILESVHPSPLSFFKGFSGNGHFLKCNDFLKKNENKEIEW